MSVAQHPPHGDLAFATPGTKVQLSRQATAGRAQRLAFGIYAIGATLPAEAVSRHHQYEIIAHFWPGAIVSGPSALAGGSAVNGVLFIAAPEGRQAAIVLPGLKIQPTRGPGPLPGDMPLPAGLHISGPARMLVENVATGSGRPARHRAGSGRSKIALTTSPGPEAQPGSVWS